MQLAAITAPFKRQTKNKIKDKRREPVQREQRYSTLYEALTRLS